MLHSFWQSKYQIFNIFAVGMASFQNLFWILTVHNSCEEVSQPYDCLWGKYCIHLNRPAMINYSIFKPISSYLLFLHTKILSLINSYCVWIMLINWQLGNSAHFLLDFQTKTPTQTIIFLLYSKLITNNLGTKLSLTTQCYIILQKEMGPMEIHTSKSIILTSV